MNTTISGLLLAIVGWSVQVQAALVNDVSIQFDTPNPRYDAATRKFVVAGTLTNTSTAPVPGPISLVLDGFQPANHSVIIDSSDGVLPDGKDYIVIHPQPELAVGQAVAFEFFLSFANPISDDAVSVFDQLTKKAFKVEPATVAKFAVDYHLLRIPAGNQPPLAHAGSDLEGDVATELSLDGSLSSDPDNDALSYSWKLLLKPQASLAKLVNPTTAKPSFTGDVPGNYQASLVVSDGYVQSPVDTVNIKMNAVPGVNQPPFISSAAQDSATATRGYNYQVLAGDPDGDELMYTLLVAPQGMTINGTGMVAWEVPNTPHVMPAVTIRVSDGQYSVEQSFAIHIQPCTC